MKYLIPVLLAIANISLALSVALKGHVSDDLQQVLYGLPILLSLAAAYIAIELSRREALQNAPQLLASIDLPKVARENPGLGIHSRVPILKNSSPFDAFNVQVQRLCLDAGKKVYVDFELVSHIAAGDEAEIKSIVEGLKSSPVKDNFETVYLYGEQNAHIQDFHVEYELFYEYSDFSGKNHYKAGMHFSVDTISKAVKTKWLGAKRLWRRG